MRRDTVVSLPPAGSAEDHWPIAITWPVAWGDQDAMSHVNNTVYLKWFETARIAYFDALGLTKGMHGTGVGPILATQSIDYKRPVAYPDTVTVQTRITHLGTTSFTMHFRIVSEALGLAAEGDGVCVMYDYARATKIAISEELRRAIQKLESGVA